MIAKETEFKFMAAAMSIEVPYFQRAYVWNEENWEELLRNLLEDGQSHFLGSIILKQLETKSGDIPRWSVIDGQQRLTTLSILLRACYDALPLEKYDERVVSNIENNMRAMLFFTRSQLEVPNEVKIRHSLIDAPDYKEVVEGDTKKILDSIILDSEIKKGQKATSSNILKCYKFFYNKLNDNPADSQKLWETLLSEQNKILVKIDLGYDENEQAIFDTINSAGVRLTCADTIKNALFQKGMENAGQDENEQKKVIHSYKNEWEKTFSSTRENIEYWGTERQLGRMKRDNLEILLHSVALIKKFYDPDCNTISDLPRVYKEYIANFNNNEIFAFVKEISEYADVYKKFFYVFNKTTLFRFSDDIQRLFHVLSVCEVSTLDPYILKLLKDYNVKDDGTISVDLLIELKKIESFVMRHAISRRSIKNFNKVCAMLIDGKTTIEEEIESKKEFLEDEFIKQSLKAIPNNKIGALILFWIELKREAEDKKFGTAEQKFTYSLEHIMPQAWTEYWKVDEYPVCSVINGTIIDGEEAEEVRNLAIFEIGNMTLLASSLNTSLRNYQIAQKIEGEGRKRGIRYYANLSIAKEIVDIYDMEKKWDEVLIRQRTESLSKEFFEIW